MAAHVRSVVRGRHTTDPAHMPKAHQRHLEWTPSRIITWAGTIGAQTTALVEAILADRPHPEQGYRSCLGILRLTKRYGLARLEAACARAVSVDARSYRHVDSILKHGLEPAHGAGGPAATPSAPRPRAPPRARVLPRRGRSGGAGTRRRGRECSGRGIGTYGRPRETRS